MNFRVPNAKLSVFAIVIAISVSMLASTISITQTATAQNQSQGQSTGNAPLNFYLKLNNNQTTSKAASQAASNGTGTKNMTITVSVQKGPSGNPIKLPISAIVPNNINQQDLQLCASLSNGQQMCQALGQNASNIDLSSAANSTAKATPQSYQENKASILGISLGSLVQYADAQLLSVNNTTLNIPITVIVPITLEIQNAQICATVASSGGQSCQQIVLNPTQSAFTPVNVDLSNPTTPTVTTLPAAVPSTQQLTGSPAGTSNTSGAAVTNNTAGALTNTLGAVTNNTVGVLTNNTLGTVANNTSSGMSGSNATSSTSSGTGNNNTSDNTGSSSNQSTNPTTSQQPTPKPPQDNTATKDKKNQDNKDNTGNSNNGNSGN
jgi:trimeric autotransporter adhesin